MSEYATVHGRFNCETRVGVGQIVAKLSELGYLQISGGSYTLDGKGAEQDFVDETSVTIPQGNYRNLHRHVEALTPYASDFHVAIASFDGAAYGEVLKPTRHVEVDLVEWAQENGFRPRSELEFEERAEWDVNVANAFTQLEQGHKEKPKI